MLGTGAMHCRRCQSKGLSPYNGMACKGGSTGGKLAYSRFVGTCTLEKTNVRTAWLKSLASNPLGLYSHFNCSGCGYFQGFASPVEYAPFNGWTNFIIRSLSCCSTFSSSAFFPIWSRHIKFSITAFSGLLLLLSFSFVSSLITSLHLNFGLPIFRCPLNSIFHVLITISSSGFFLHMTKPSQSRFSYFLNHVCHTCPSSYFFMLLDMWVFLMHVRLIS